MNVYLVETGYKEYKDKFLVAANDYNEAGRIFTEQINKYYGTKNAIKDLKCSINKQEEIQTNVNTPKILLNPFD